MQHTNQSSASPLDEALAIVGGQAALAALLGYPDRRNVWPWTRGGKPLPTNHCPQIERATKGAVTVERLRPDAAWVRVKDKNWPHPSGRPLLDVAAGPMPVAAAEPATADQKAA